MAAASYHLWVAKDWESHVALARETMAALFTIAVGVSFLVAMLLAVVMLWLKLPTWIVTLASAILGPVIGAGAMVLIMRAL